MGQTDLNEMSQDFSQFYPRLREIRGSSPAPSPTQIKGLERDKHFASTMNA